MARGSNVRAYSIEENITAFWMKVDKNAPNGCWLWTGSTKGQGYGQTMLTGHQQRAHRIAWLLLNGHPGDREVAHTCDNRLCVNPAHLFLATHQENMDDMKAKGRHAFGVRLPGALLTEEAVRIIRAEYVKISPRRSNARALGARFGVSAAVVRAAAKGESWKHVK